MVIVTRDHFVPALGLLVLALSLIGGEGQSATPGPWGLPPDALPVDAALGWLPATNIAGSCPRRSTGSFLRVHPAAGGPSCVPFGNGYCGPALPEQAVVTECADRLS